MASRVAVEEVSIGIESFQVTKILLKTQRAEQDLGTIQYRRTGKREINLIREERQTIQYRNRRRLESSSTSQQHAEGSSRRVTFRGVHYSSDISPHSSQQHMQHPYQRINQRHGQQVLNVLLTLLVHQMGNFLLHFQTWSSLNSRILLEKKHFKPSLPNNLMGIGKKTKQRRWYNSRS